MNHDKFYSKAYFYDVAFRFKDIKSENDTLINVFKEINSRPPKSFLDIAAGPAANAIEMAKRGIKSFAIDISNEMVEYGKQLALENDLTLTYLQADMCDFKLPEKVDVATIFMASTGYILTNEDMVKHLRAVWNSLNPQGVYVLEMLHPRDVFSVGKSTSTAWEATDGDVKVSVRWGDESDIFDPITQIKMVTAHLKYQTPTESGEIVEQSKQREYTFQEMRALIKLSGTFELVKMLGSWDIAVPFSNENSAWRMILILQKIGD